jgi:replicative DNA helicase
VTTAFDIAPASDRTPPHNVAAEKSVLGSVFIKAAAFNEALATGLQTDDFFLPAHREIFDAMLATVKRGRPLDVVAVADELKTRGMLSRLPDREGYLLVLAGAVPTAENVAHYAELVKQKAKLRQLIAACAEIQSRASGDFGEFKLFMDQAAREIAKVTTMDTLEEPLLTISEIVRAAKPLPDPVSTGVLELDVLLGEGLYVQSMYLLPGAEGRGKTAMAAQISRHISLERVVVIISTELRAQQMAARIAAPILGRPWREVWRRMHLEKDLIERAISDRRLVIVDGTRRNLDPRHIFDQAARKFGQTPFVVIDYVQDLTRRRGSPQDDRRLAVAASSDEIKQWTMDVNGTALLVSSVGRVWSTSASKAERSTRDYAASGKESGDLDFDAAGIISVDIDECPLGGVTTATLRVAKSRYGTSGEVRLAFHGALGLFVPMGVSVPLTALERSIIAVIERGATSRAAIQVAIGGRRATVLRAVTDLINRRILSVDLTLQEGAL